MFHLFRFLEMFGVLGQSRIMSWLQPNPGEKNNLCSLELVAQAAFSVRAWRKKSLNSKNLCTRIRRNRWIFKYINKFIHRYQWQMLSFIQNFHVEVSFESNWDHSPQCIWSPGSKNSVPTAGAKSPFQLVARGQVDRGKLSMKLPRMSFIGRQRLRAVRELHGNLQIGAALPVQICQKYPEIPNLWVCWWQLWKCWMLLNLTIRNASSKFKGDKEKGSKTHEVWLKRNSICNTKRKTSQMYPNVSCGNLSLCFC